MTTESINRAQAIVAQLRKLGVTAVIAGGFARDSVYGRRIKDVDVFVETEGDGAVVKNVVPILKAVFQATLVKREGLTAEEYEIPKRDFGYVHRIDSADTCVLGCPIDVMYVDDIDAKIERFPDALSRVVLDGTAVEQYPESFADFVAKRITYYEDLTQANHQARLSRLLDKYEGFEVVSA